MNTITQQFKRMFVSNNETNFTFTGISPFKPAAPKPNPVAIENHKTTVLHAMCKYFTPDTIEQVLLKRRSTIDPELVMLDFFEGDIPPQRLVKDDHYWHAVDYTRRLFMPPHKCRPAHILDILHHYPTKHDTNAEAPFSTEPFFLKQLNDPVYRERHNLPENAKPSTGNMKNIIFDWVRLWHHEIKNNEVPFDKYMYYMLLHTKTSIVDEHDPDKLRTIWGFPKVSIYARTMFLWSYVAYLKRNPGKSPILWGYETILGGWFKLNHELSTSYFRSTIVTLDKSRFDKYFLFEIMDDIENIYRSYLDFENGYLPTREYPHTDTTWNHDKAQRLERLWQFTCYTFRNTPIVIPDGRTYKRKFAGMPSGCYDTQLSDTFHFSITDLTVLFQLGFTEEQILVRKGQGDDIIYSLSVFIPPNEHETFLTTYSLIDNQRFGSVTRPEKCEVTNSPDGAQSLGYRNHRGIPHRSTIDLLAQLYFTKALNPTPSITMSIATGIAYASLGIDRQLYQVCREIYDYYARQGYSLDPNWVNQYVSTDPMVYALEKYVSFPSISKIQRHLINLSYAEPETMQSFFPDSWFLSHF